MKVVCVLFLAISASAQDVPRIFLSDPHVLVQSRGKKDSPPLARLKQEAERALKVEPVSVTSKTFLPPSGDKHDYLSLAPYWWPDPKKPDGKPYIRKDGERNPEIEAIQDHKNFDTVMNNAYTLGLAFYLLGDERYAAHATKLLRVWFLEPETRMNPNLQYAQGIPGINTGRGTGLIETRGIGKIVDAVGLLAGSQAWTKADQDGLQKWCADFLQWMRESKNGKDEAKATNNHGTYYDVQIAALALFTGDTKIAKTVLEGARERRIAAQVEPDGRQPRELERTKSFSYSAMNLTGLFELARLGDAAGIDLWSFNKDGRSIRAALDFLLPFARGEKKWTYQQIEPIKAKELAPLALLAAQHYSAPEYRAAAAALDPDLAASREALLLPNVATSATTAKSASK